MGLVLPMGGSISWIGIGLFAGSYRMGKSLNKKQDSGQFRTNFRPECVLAFQVLSGVCSSKFKKKSNLPQRVPGFFSALRAVSFCGFSDSSFPMCMMHCCFKHEKPVFSFSFFGFWIVSVLEASLLGNVQILTRCYEVP